MFAEEPEAKKELWKVILCPSPNTFPFNLPAYEKLKRREICTCCCWCWCSVFLLCRLLQVVMFRDIVHFLSFDHPGYDILPNVKKTFSGDFHYRE